VRSKAALSAPEAAPAIGQADSVVAALLEKRSALAADLAVAEDTVTCLRHQITALSETLKTFGYLEPEESNRNCGAARAAAASETGWAMLTRMAGY
jgi:hypothetical protein